MSAEPIRPARPEAAARAGRRRGAPLPPGLPLASDRRRAGLAADAARGEPRPCAPTRRRGLPDLAARGRSPARGRRPRAHRAPGRARAELLPHRLSGDCRGARVENPELGLGRRWRADPAELFVLREMEMQAVLLVPLVVEGRTWGLDRGLRLAPALLPRSRAAPRRARRGADRRPPGSLRARGARAAPLPRDSCLALERTRGQGRGHERAHRGSRPARRRRRGRARAGPRSGSQRRAWPVLHDIGKVRVPEAILNKPGSLTEEEWTVMRTHPEVGERILRPIQSLQAILPIVRHHHERWDGTGYPGPAHWSRDPARRSDRRRV